MTNLSDLMPAGAAAKTITATATASITTKKPVILNSAGTVTQVGDEAVAASLGALSTASDAAAHAGTTQGITYDSAGDRLIGGFYDGTSRDLYAVAGSVSGTTITWGTPAEAVDAITGSEPVQCIYEVSTGNTIFFYDTNTTTYFYAVAGKVDPSDGSWSFGSPTVIESVWSRYTDVAYDSVNGKVLFAYFANGANDGRVAIVSSDASTKAITVAGITDYSVGSNVVTMGICYDTSQSAFVVMYNNNSNLTYARVGTISGTTITFGTETAVNSQGNGNCGHCSYDSAQSRVVLLYRDTNASDYGYGRVGTVTGGGTRSISVGAATAFTSAHVGGSIKSSYAGTEAGVTTVLYTPDADGYVRYLNATVTGGSTNTVAFNTATRLYSDNSACNAKAFNVCEFTSGKTATIFAPAASVGSITSNFAYGKVIQNAADVPNLTATNFVGVADEAISGSASGKIVVQGGTITGLSSLTTGSDYYVRDDATFNTTAGTPSVKAGVALSATSLLLNGDT